MVRHYLDIDGNNGADTKLGLWFGKKKISTSKPDAQPNTVLIRTQFLQQSGVPAMQAWGRRLTALDTDIRSPGDASTAQSRSSTEQKRQFNPRNK